MRAATSPIIAEAAARFPEAAGLAALFYLGTFSAILAEGHFVGLTVALDPRAILLRMVPTILAILAAASALALLSARFPRLYDWCLLGGMVLGANNIRRGLMASGAIGPFSAHGAGTALALGAALGMALRPDATRAALRRLFPLLAFVAPVVVASCVHQALTLAPLPHGRSAAINRAARRPPRIVVLVFDELDSDFAFTLRPAGLALPNLDELRRTSFTALNGVSPFPSTVYALPSITLGRPVSSLTVPASRTIVYRTPEGEEIDWRRSNTLFHEARRRGANVAAAGWVLPYCAFFGDAMARCVQAPEFPVVHDSWTRPSWKPFLMDLHIATRPASQRLFPDTDLLYWVGARPRLARAMSGIHDTLSDAARRFAADPDLDFVFIHLNIPHPPAFHSVGGPRFDDGPTYFDSLELVDRVVGEVSGAIRASGAGDRTSLLVTSDHHFRAKIWIRRRESHPSEESLAGRVDKPHLPLLFQIPGRAAAEHAGEFPVHAVHRLVLAHLDGRADDPGRTLSGF